MIWKRVALRCFSVSTPAAVHPNSGWIKMHPLRSGLWKIFTRELTSRRLRKSEASYGRSSAPLSYTSRCALVYRSWIARKGCTPRESILQRCRSLLPHLCENASAHGVGCCLLRTHPTYFVHRNQKSLVSEWSFEIYERERDANVIWHAGVVACGMHGGNSSNG